MFNGRPHGALEIPMPAAPPPNVIWAQAPTMDEITRKPRPVDRRSVSEKLMQVPHDWMLDGAAIEIRQALLNRAVNLDEDVAAFIAERRQKHLEQLEKKHAELEAELTLLEDDKLAATNEVARLDSVKNISAKAVGAARQKLTDLETSGYGRLYPPPAQKSARKAEIDAARAELAAAQQQHQQTQSELAAAHIANAEAARVLAAKSDEASAANVALKELRLPT
jgi:hypothetical protein